MKDALDLRRYFSCPALLPFCPSLRSKKKRGLRRDNDGAEIGNVDVELSAADDDMRVNNQLDSLAAVLVYRTCTSRDALSGLSSTIREHDLRAS